MFRVDSYQAVLRVLLASGGLLVCGAVAQDQPIQANPIQANPIQANQDQKSADKSAADTASAAQTQPAQAQATDTADPLKRPTNEKIKKRNERALKQELSKTYKK